MSGDTLSLLLAGDALIVRPWSHVLDPGFLRLIGLIRGANVAIANLETVVHEFKGYAQADSGGVYAHSPPPIADELAWAGFDMLAHANNHAFDYGSSGILETVEHIGRAGLKLAGSGKDLQEARAPRYFERGGVTVAMVAMASTYVLYGRASRSRVDLPGRPGLNPLAVHLPRPTVMLPHAVVGALRTIAGRVGGPFVDLGADGFEFGVRVLEGRPAAFRDRWSKHEDREANLAAISAAAANADIVIASIHAHLQGRWLRAFAIEAIARGADIVFIHGPHEIRGIELHRGKPILYCLGDFAFESGFVDPQPADAYDRLKLKSDATIDDLRSAAGPIRDLTLKRATFEGLVAQLVWTGGKFERLRLHPLDLGFDASDDSHGRPRIADPARGEMIIARLAERSRPLGTRVRYDAAENVGEIQC